MATSQNRRNTKEGSDQGTTKKNYTGQRFGNDHGEIRFGQIDKQARVTAGCQMNAKEGTHTFSMDNDGEREGCTTSICPQRLQMDCGRDSKKEEDSMVFYADNGNIVINAGNGNMRFIANNVEFTVKGDDGTEGNFIVNASESILLDSKKIQGTAKNFVKWSSPGKMELCANENLKLYGGVIRGVTDAVSGKDSKLGGKNFWTKQQP